jgi:hypothetical protein
MPAWLGEAEFDPSTMVQFAVDDTRADAVVAPSDGASRRPPPPVRTERARRSPPGARRPPTTSPDEDGVREQAVREVATPPAPPAYVPAAGAVARRPAVWLQTDDWITRICDAGHFHPTAGPIVDRWDSAMRCKVISCRPLF